uniref:GAG-pre-integrase domain-containing protein n=1 Tax=Tanacetum cinerariifolium TaxID=118510 RepID=A0A6L2LYA7_TANCI|nr:hypothetical protein [Tanacetum cinerariifolium]
MSSASSAVTYTFVYTDSKPRRVFWGANKELLDGGSSRVIVYGYDGLPLLTVAPPSPYYVHGPEKPQTPPAPRDEDKHKPMFIQLHDPDFMPKPIYLEYIPLEDEHILLAEEQPLPPVVSPTAESLEYVAGSDLKEDPEEYRDDETEDGLVDYPMDRGDNRDDDDDDSSGDDAYDEDEDEEDEEHLASTDSAVVIPIDELVSPPKGTEPAAISFSPETEVERLLTMPTPSPSALALLSPPSVKERLPRWTALDASLLSPPLHMPPPVDRRDDIPESEMPPRKRLCLFTLGSKYEVEESFTTRPTEGQEIDYRFVSTLDVMIRSERNTHISSQAGLRRPRQGLGQSWSLLLIFGFFLDHLLTCYVRIKRHHDDIRVTAAQVKGTENSSSSLNSYNMAFVSSSRNTNEVNTAYRVSTANTQANPASTQVNNASTQVSTANLSDATVHAFLAYQPNESQLAHDDLLQIYEDDLKEIDLKWQLALLSMRTRRFFQKTGRKITINGNDTAGYDKSKVKCFNRDKMGHFAREVIFTSKADLYNIGLEEFQQLKFKGYGSKTSKSVSKDISNELKEYLDASLVKDRVLDNKDCSVESPVLLEKKTIVPTIAKFEVVRPKQQEKPVRKTLRRAEMYRSQGPRPRLVNTARPNLVVVNDVKANQVNAVKASACWVWRPTKPNGVSITLKRHNYIDGHPQKVQEDQGYVDSGCSRHMTEMSYLSDFKEFDREYVTFGRGANGGRITCKGTLKLDFKLADETQVLLKVPRRNNMYSVDMKNIVPKESLTCLVAKATLNESMLWHMRLGHINFKNINMYNINNSSCCKSHTCEREFSVARTPQQNGVAKRRNKTLIEAARTIKALRVYNLRTRKVEENLHIRFLEDKPSIAGNGPKWLSDIDVLTKSMNYVPVVADMKSASTPVDMEKTLVKDADVDDVDVHLYISMIRL